MEKINNRYLSKVAFIIFLINIMKYILINVSHFINPYGSINMKLSYIMFPTIIIGVLIFFKILVNSIYHKNINILNFVFSLPIIIFFIYFFFIK